MNLSFPYCNAEEDALKFIYENRKEPHKVANYLDQWTLIHYSPKYQQNFYEVENAFYNFKDVKRTIKAINYIIIKSNIH